MINLLKDGNGIYAMKLDFLRTWSVSHYFRFLSFAYIIKQHNVISILDVGFGDNKFIYFLEKMKFIGNYHGIDLNDKYVKCAKESKLNKKFHFNREYSCIDIFHLTNTRKYNCIILGEIIEHIPKSSIVSFLTQIKKLLYKNGIILLSTPNKQNNEIVWPNDHIDEFNLIELQQICQDMNLTILNEYGIWNNTQNTLEMLSDDEKLQYFNFAQIIPNSILNVIFNILHPNKSKQIILILSKK